MHRVENSSVNTFSLILAGVVAATVLLALFILFVWWQQQTHASDARTYRMIAERDPKLDRLWEYLETFRHSEDVPSREEIRARFGQPSSQYELQLVASEYVSESHEPTVGPNEEPCELYSFSQADLAASSVKVQASRYEYKGMEDEFPWIEIYVRKADGKIIGWEWAWMDLPQGNAMGPPRIR